MDQCDVTQQSLSLALLFVGCGDSDYSSRLFILHRGVQVLHGGQADSQSSVELALSLGEMQWGNQTVMDDVEKLSAIDPRNWTTL